MQHGKVMESPVSYGLLTARRYYYRPRITQVKNLSDSVVLLSQLCNPLRGKPEQLPNLSPGTTRSPHCFDLVTALLSRLKQAFVMIRFELALIDVGYLIHALLLVVTDFTVAHKNILDKCVVHDMIQSASHLITTWRYT
jgi:hypothetical protein